MRSRREKRPRASPPPSAADAAAAPAAPRVGLEASTLSLREQLKLARLSSAPAASKPVARTKFRRKKDGSFQSGRHSRPDDAVVPDGKYAVQAEPLLYVDAYNVIGAWPRLRKQRDRGDMGAARRLLLDVVGEFASVRGWECVVVFDAHGNELPGRSDVTPQSVQVVFTGSETADSYIERAVFEGCEEDVRQVWAATSDVAQLRFTTGKGAHVMSASLFVQELKRARKETRERVDEVDESAARGKMFISNVDEDTRNALYALRDRLNGS